MKVIITPDDVRDLVLERLNLPSHAELVIEGTAPPSYSPAQRQELYAEMTTLLRELQDYHTGAGINRVTAIRAMRMMLPFLGLKEAKDLLETYTPVKAS